MAIAVEFIEEQFDRNTEKAITRAQRKKLRKQNLLCFIYTGDFSFEY